MWAHLGFMARNAAESTRRVPVASIGDYGITVGWGNVVENFARIGRGLQSAAGKTTIGATIAGLVCLFVEKYGVDKGSEADHVLTRVNNSTLSTYFFGVALAGLGGALAESKYAVAAAQGAAALCALTATVSAAAEAGGPELAPELNKFFMALTTAFFGYGVLQDGNMLSKVLALTGMSLSTLTAADGVAGFAGKPFIPEAVTGAVLPTAFTTYALGNFSKILSDTRVSDKDKIFNLCAALGLATGTVVALTKYDTIMTALLTVATTFFAAIGQFNGQAVAAAENTAMAERRHSEVQRERFSDEESNVGSDDATAPLLRKGSTTAVGTAMEAVPASQGPGYVAPVVAKTKDAEVPAPV